MMSFKYKPIDLEGHAFRLLRLLKGDDDLIQCELFESKLAPPEYGYAALSYTWGSESRPCEIIINGSKMTVTKNAYLALRDLRYQERDRFLWIDALCIDQDNREEREQQVKQMGSIYSTAERVVIWLGEATYDTNYVMQHMKQLQEGIKHASNNGEILEEQRVNIWSAVVHSLIPDQRALLVEGLQSLLRRNWFKRVWIIQETAKAQDAEIVCGGKSVSASILALTISLLKITPDPHCQPILDIMPGPLRNSSSWWAKKPDLYTMLVKFRKSEATDPRDSIYALLGISSDACDTDLLKVNYKKNLQDVIFDTTSFLLDFNKLDSPICRFFDWTLSKFLGNLNLLANEVLKCAMNTGHEALVKLLIVRDDVDVNIKVSGRTPLLWAAEKGHEAVVKLLLEKGAELETKDMYHGRTPLSWAAGNGHEAVVKLLLEKGAELETKGSNGQTPLSYAAWDGHEAVVKLLLEKGAELETKDSNNGRTPLSWAAERGHEAVVKLLLEKGAELETKDPIHRRTPLLWAAERGHEAVVKLLLEKGAEKPQS
jgi:ankyrin repeat protein